jgi:hypothetical protein
VLSAFLPPLLCASFQFVFYCSFLSFFFFVGESDCLRGNAGLSQGWLAEYCMMLGAHLFGLLNVFQTGLEPVASGGCSSPVFSV